jgi:hypothetical protein
MKKLTPQQIILIEKKLPLNSKNWIVLLDTAGKKEISKEESNRNVYCIDENYEIRWQIKHEERPMLGRNSFVHIKCSENNFFALDFAGFTYKINIENGDTKIISWDK